MTTKYVDSDGFDRSSGDAVAASIVAKMYRSEEDGHEQCRADSDQLRAEVQFYKTQNEGLHEQLNEIRRVVWEGPGTAQIMNKLRNMMDRPK